MASKGAKKGLLERLGDSETVLVASGYLQAFERRCYLQAGAFVPEVVIDYPELVKQQHEEFVHAGSDVVLAFTYYGHRAKLRLIGRENDLELLNRKALQIARQVADNTGTLMAGNICNTTLYNKDDPKTHEDIRGMYKEQIGWAVEEKADYIVGETFKDFGEASIALECIKRFGNGLPSVVTLAPHNSDVTLDGIPWAEGCRLLERQGADVVGLNCHRGPETMLPLLADVKSACKGHVAVLPAAFRTSEDCVNFFSLKNPKTGAPSYPADMDSWFTNRSDMAEFAQEAHKLGFNYIGMCCGGNAGHLRSMAEALGKEVPGSRYSPNMKDHYMMGTREEFKGSAYQTEDTLKSVLDIAAPVYE